jgi:hypothetical protein
MYKFELNPKSHPNSKDDEGAPRPPYATELDEFSDFLSSVIPHLQYKNEQWSAIEQLWRHTIGHSIDQIVADCNDIDSK